MDMQVTAKHAPGIEEAEQELARQRAINGEMRERMTAKQQGSVSLR